jgi:hypothetical protein
MENVFMRLDCFTLRKSVRSILSVSVFVGLVALFASCQSSTSPKAAPSGPEKRVFSYTDTAVILADSVSWTRGTDTGAAEVSGTKEKRIQLTLPSPLGSSSVTLNVWTLGIRTAVAECKAATESGLTPVKGFVRDSLTLVVIGRLYGLHKIDPVVYPYTRAGLIKAYARDLVEGAVTGFPGNRPHGMDSAAVVKAAILYQTAKKQAFVSIFSSGATFLGLDSSIVHVQILKLIGNEIPKTDSLILFPLPPVRVKTAISLEHDTLVNRGAKIGVKGEFEADLSKGIAYIEVAFLDSNGVFDSGVTVANLPQPGGAAQCILDQKLYIRADSARLGRHTVVVKASDASKKYFATSSKTFLVLPAPPAPDLAGPSIELVAPGKLAIQVGSDTSSYVIKAKVADTSGIATVLIGDTAAKLADGVWSRTVQLPIPGRTEVFEIKSTDSTGNESKTSVFITRKSLDGAKGPSVTLLNSASSLSLPFEQKTVVLTWLVTDTAGLKSVDLNRVDLQSSSDTFSREVTIPATGDSVEFRLFAINKNLVGTEKSVKVVRAKDQIAPVVGIDSASWLAAGVLNGDTLVVPTSSTSVSLKWKATDNHYVSALTLDGDTLTKGSDGLYTWEIKSLAAGLTKATIIAADSIGNKSIVYAKLMRMDRVTLNFSLDSVFIDSGYAKVISTTPGAIVEYSLDGSTWTAVPEKGIRLTGSSAIQFRGRAPGFTDVSVTKNYVVKITPPPEAKGAVWNEFNWDDKLIVWQ